MKIRKATLKDVNDIVEIHMDAFRGFFLTSLGPSFLRLYYTCFIRSEDTITMVAEENNIIWGFSALTRKSKGFNSSLIKSNIFDFVLLSTRLLFTSPKSLIRLVKNLTKKSDDVEDDENYAELYSIGVNKVAQGKGVGKALLSASELKLKDAEVKRVSLTTDYNDNKQAIGFYQSMGYEIMYDFVTYPNRRMYRFIKEL